VAGQRFNAERPLYADEIQLASVGLGSGLDSQPCEFADRNLSFGLMMLVS